MRVGKALLWATLLTASWGCRVEAPGRPIRPGFQGQRAQRGRPVVLNYSWDLGAQAVPPGSGYLAFVHFLDGGRVVFTDDHVPVPPPTTWKPGTSYRYARVRFLDVPDTTRELEVRMGLYDPAGSRRLTLEGKHAGMHEYSVGRLAVGSPLVAIPLVYRGGWYLEDPGADGHQRIWTARTARTTFDNPRRDVIIYLESESNRAAFKTAPTMSVQIGDYGATAPVDLAGPSVAGFRFPAEALGAGDSAEVRVSTSETFIPRQLGLNVDDRELGLLVSRLEVVPASEPVPEPLRIVDARRGPVAVP
jgi:hypothetical protein